MLDSFHRFLKDAAVWSLYSVGRTSGRALNKLLAALYAPAACFRVLWGRLRGRLELPYMDCVVGTRCTLRCKNCANLMPCFTKPGVLNAEQIIDDMGRLLACVDFIKTVGVLGGEPLLNPDLPRIVAWLLAHPKVGYVEVVTNGTLVPGEALLNALHNRCASLVVSDYRAYSRAVPAIKKVCGAKGVKAVILQINSWRGYGGTDARGRSIDRLEAVFAGCRSYHCRSLLNGLFHLCPRSSSGHAIGIFNASGDCVNIRALDSASAREALRSLLYRQPFIKACDYCDNSSACRTDDVPVAEQV